MQELPRAASTAAPRSARSGSGSGCAETAAHGSAAAALALGAQLHRALGLAEEVRIMRAEPPAESAL